MKKMFLITLLIFSVNLFALDQLNISKQTNKKEEKVIYTDMISYLSKSNDPEQLMILGSLYASGSKDKDSIGEIFPNNPYLAQKYLLEAANKGKYRALTILGGFILLKDNMRILDPSLKKTEKYLLNAFYAGDLEAGTLLSNLYFQKNEPEKAINILYITSDKNDSNAQLALAILFKDGLYLNGKEYIMKDLKSAEYYLNLACNNPNKSEKVNNFCFNNKTINIITKD